MVARPARAIASLIAWFVIAVSFGCVTQPTAAPESTASSQSKAATDLATADAVAAVTAVSATSQNGEGYTFAVTVTSPDTGCGQYADWWEVVSADGDLLYRRILAHSHVDEQPFERSGGPVAIAPDQTVIVRVHMYPDGYSTQAMQGSPEAGFQTVTLAEAFATDLAAAEPQPDGCAF